MPDTNPVRWVPDRAPPVFPWPDPPMLTAVARGVVGRCPACGHSRLFRRWLRVSHECPACHAPLGEVRADDAPPYFTIFITGHVIVGLMLMLERQVLLGVWTEAAIFLPLTLAMALLLLQPVKGGTVGLMLKLGLFKQPDDND